MAESIHPDHPGNNQKLPITSSPSARAFFAALDENQQRRSSDKKKQTSSSYIQKRIQTLGWRNRYSQNERYPVQILDDHYSVLQVQRGELEGTYGTGATVWPASMVLIKYLEKNAEILIQNKTVIDLGSGTGVTSIAAAILGAQQVLCTDGQASVVSLARDNIQYAATHELLTTTKDTTCTIPAANNDDTNHSESLETTDSTRLEVVTATAQIHNCPVMVQEYWWGSKGQIRMNGSNTTDVILVSDCVLPKLYPIGPLVQALDDLLVKSDAVAILSYEHRHYPDYHPKQKFMELCHAKYLHVETIPIEQQDPIYSVDDIEIWHVTRMTDTR